MTCDKNCGEKNCNGNCKDKVRSKQRLEDLKNCDQWRCACGNGCDAKAAKCNVCKLPRRVGECVQYGVHANALRKADDMSPDDVARVMSYYKMETVVLPPAGAWLPVLGNPLFYYIALGNIKVSHDFCLLTVPTGLTEDDLTPLTPVRWGVAGTEIACIDGSWVWVINPPALNEPALPPNVVIGGASTGIVCNPCPPPPCAAVPANGSEVFYIELAAPLGLGESVVGGTLTVSRCNWLQQVRADIGAQNGRSRLFPVPATRVTPGSIPAF